MAFDYTIHERAEAESGVPGRPPRLPAIGGQRNLAFDTPSDPIQGPCEICVLAETHAYLSISSAADAGDPGTSAVRLFGGLARRFYLPGGTWYIEASAGGSGLIATQAYGGATEAKQDTQIARMPAALAAGGGLKVEGVAGGVAQPVSGPMTSTEFLANMRSGTVTHSSVNSGIASVTLLASNANRKGASITNTDANALLIDTSGGTASSSRFHKRLAQNETYELPYGITGAITGIWEADGSGAALVAEAA